MNSAHYYDFRADGRTLEAGYGTMRYIRQRGRELAMAEPKKRVDVHIAINKETRLEHIGAWRPDGIFIDSWGHPNRLSPDGQSLISIK